MWERASFRTREIETPVLDKKKSIELWEIVGQGQGPDNTPTRVQRGRILKLPMSARESNIVEL